MHCYVAQYILGAPTQACHKQANNQPQLIGPHFNHFMACNMKMSSRLHIKSPLTMLPMITSRNTLRLTVQFLTFLEEMNQSPLTLQ